MSGIKFYDRGKLMQCALNRQTLLQCSMIHYEAPEAVLQFLCVFRKIQFDNWAQ